MKGIISKCDLFVGARMHSNIAALSSKVPTLAISYSHKFKGIMEQMGQGDYVIDVEEIGIEKLGNLVDTIWNKRDEIRKTLEVKMELIEKEKEILKKIILDIMQTS